MATLSYGGASYYNCVTTVNYTVAYNPSTNTSTVTFQQSSHATPGASGWGVNQDTTITVSAGDSSGSSGQATFITSGTGNGGIRTLYGTPSPVSITVYHSAGAGAKTVTVSGSSHFLYYYNNGANKNNVYPSGSQSHTVATICTLSVSAGVGASAAVVRTSSSVGAATGAVSPGATIFNGDVLAISYYADTGYAIASVFPAAGSYTVTGDVGVSVTATVLSYTLTITTDAGAIVSVQRTDSPKAGAAIGALSNGSTVYHSDVLSISVSAAGGYIVDQATLNGGPVISPHTVTAAVTITASSTAVGAKITISGTPADFTLIIYDNGSWGLYVPYVYTNNTWSIY